MSTAAATRLNFNPTVVARRGASNKRRAGACPDIMCPNFQKLLDSTPLSSRSPHPLPSVRPSPRTLNITHWTLHPSTWNSLP